MDAALGDLLAPLRPDGTLDETLVVAVGDHGESLGDHGEATHGALCYDRPCACRCWCAARTGAAPASAASPGQRRRRVPDRLEALGLGPPRDVDGRDLWRRDPPARGVYFESYAGYLDYGWSPLAGWYRERVKVLLSTSPELYRLDADPDEGQDRYVAEAPAATLAREALAGVWAARRLERDDDAAFAPELLAELRELRLRHDGRAGRRAALAAGAQRPARPARPRAQLVVLLEATALGQERDHGKAVELLRTLLDGNPATAWRSTSWAFT